VILSVVDLYGNEASSPPVPLELLSRTVAPVEVPRVEAPKAYSIETISEGLRVTLSSLILFDVGKEELKDSSKEAKAKREEIAYVKKVLTNPQSKSLYDQAGIEPTIFTHKIGDTLYLYISKISPTTFGEFAYAIDSASSTKRLNSMIIDFRGNVGGSLDFLQNFLGLFVGPNQYAFDLFHQGDYQVQRTVQPKFPLLDRYKEIAIITDNMTQSTAELTAATFKRLHLAKVVGTNTRGWGTVENTYPVETVIDPSVKYTLLLVNSVTLRDDNQSIEGMGVDPNIRTTEKTWKGQLTNVFNSTSLIDALKQTAGVPPLK
jgi:C-terminal processing protease CtpA/Prc